MQHVSKETLLTAKITLKAERMRLEHLRNSMARTADEETMSEYKHAIIRIDRALADIEMNL